MFDNTIGPIRREMLRLEEIDLRDRSDGTPRLQRLRQIPPETGRFLAIMAANTPPGHFVEIGASAGYSALWIALACREAGRTLVTYEVLPEKVRLAEQTFKSAEVEDVVTLVPGDAREHLGRLTDVAFCFLDAEKEVYLDCYEAIVPRMVPGGILAADNAINHRETLQSTLDRAVTDPRVDALVVPIGKGVLLCRRTGGE
jgi:caffeoyl-CoA O-methyltransferase